jgi:hypothetical protein
LPRRAVEQGNLTWHPITAFLVWFGAGKECALMRPPSDHRFFERETIPYSEARVLALSPFGHTVHQYRILSSKTRSPQLASGMRLVSQVFVVA